MYDEEVERYPTIQISNDTSSGAAYVIRESLNADYRNMGWRSQKQWKKLAGRDEYLSFHLTGVDGYTPKFGRVHTQITSMQRAKLSTPTIAQSSDDMTSEAHYVGNDHNSNQHAFLKLS